MNHTAATLVTIPADPQQPPVALGEHIDDPAAQHCLTGDRPTGPLHLGHLVGSLQNRVRLQQQGIEVTVVIADYQVITDRSAMGDVWGRVYDLLADYLAVGLDPERTTFFPHSAVPALHQLMLPFLSLISDAELRRNPTVKAELADSGRPLSGLLLTYPVHQAADILACRATVVPVGADQLPHLELTRLIARRFNDRYGRVFREPQALLSGTPTLPGLDGRKMSKSRGNTIPIGATADQTAALVRAAPTDPERRITFDPKRRPGISALLSIAAALSGRTEVELADEIGAAGAAELKRMVTAVVNERLSGIRAARAELVADRGYLRAVLIDGIAAATALATETLTRVRFAMGTDYLAAG